MTSAMHPAVNSSPARGLFLFAVIAVAAALAGGCSGRDFAALLPGIETRGHYIPGVPFVRQKTDSDCGPASLASVFLYRGKPADVDDITARITLPRLRGTLTIDMERFAREQGLQAWSSAGTLDSLKAAVRRDAPVICLLDLGFGPYQQPHYVTVIGFDDANDVVVVHDGKTPNRVMSCGAFDRAWARAGRWMLVITPREQAVGP